MSRARAPADRVVEWGSASIPAEGEVKSGDVCVVAPFPGGCLTGVIDGLGHGAEARKAASAAARVLRAHAAEHPIDLLERCHRGLRKTRGAVMSLASFDAHASTMTWSGVGNVDGVLLRAGAGAAGSHNGIVLRGGVVGYQMPPLRAEVLAVSFGDTLIFATDGVRSDFVADFDDRGASDAQAVAERILATYARGNDDACVLVARYVGDGVTVAVHDDSDVVMVRKKARQVATGQGLPPMAVEALATAVSELARNIVVHAGAGEVVLCAVRDRGRRGVMAVARDDGPGIDDPERALEDGYTTGGGLGLGLSSARRLVDEFVLSSSPGRGTTVTVKKWSP